MYIPGYFRITNPDTIEEFIRLNSFATIISKGDLFPSATHIPVELEINENGDKVLWGHLSRANPQWKQFEQSREVLVVFLSSLNQYISSSWYNYPEAPTWNYMSVQVSGKIAIADTAKVWEMIRRLTDKYERNSAVPVSLNTLPESVQRQINGVVGFEIEIVKMEASFKLSQNRDAENFSNVLSNLRSSGNAGAMLMANMMEEVRTKAAK